MFGLNNNPTHTRLREREREWGTDQRKRPIWPLLKRAVHMLCANAQPKTTEMWFEVPISKLKTWHYFWAECLHTHCVVGFFLYKNIMMAAFTLKVLKILIFSNSKSYCIYFNITLYNSNCFILTLVSSHTCSISFFFFLGHNFSFILIWDLHVFSLILRI